MARRDAVAIFDLDRTLVPRASGRVYQRHMAEAGLAPSAGGPISEVFYRLFDVAGENWAIMQLARFAPRAMRGKEVTAVKAAADAAAEELAGEVLPFARLLAEEHQQAGRQVILATTTPDHMVRPLAERLGFDDVVATRWTAEGGVFTGSLDGPLVWGRGKLDAVRSWAADRDVDLRRSYAYSDSYFDAPLLAEVGHPTAINPDPRLSAVAALRGWPIRYLDVPPGVIKIAGRELQDLLRPLAQPWLVPNARIELAGLEHVPRTGGAILVGNHRSYFDPTVMWMIIAKAGRQGRFLGKKEVFDAPVVGQLARAAGGIRVNRGTGSDEPLVEAAQALRAGELVSLMPQGTIPRGPAFFDPVLKGRWGAARLAAMSGAPVIPVGLWGTELVWPRSARLPSLDVTHPPTVTATVGPAVELTRDDADEDTRRIMAAIVDLLPPEAREHRIPTAEELARTYPPGYRGDPAAETDRRPGSDT
jgi:putative phosphoserine phosphatase/1-acylglycerol-3-phosphate O-acyltransferase